MSEDLRFADRGEFRKWLQGNASSDDGVWLIFGKAGGPKTLKASEALEEALCFGWIDGQMQKIDDVSYRKYFSQRRANSKWSEKNKKLVVDLEKRGLMTEHGRAKIEEAKANGQWDAPKAPSITEEDIERVAQVIEPYETAHANFLGMPPSVRKTYARAYLDAKTDAGRKKRLAWMVDRLNQNLKPM
ncbi:YdeI/OmpD-associated family protein [Adlercreutzia caecimuris]|uniref:YdeI/OmpD-associated family protein n=1 Tax=Adlercreutzia caecimuris TaxID=671266 RepID=UPI002494503B|nr:YdeI/OmpD-associated family protein [Adlercreutzia caecimuris]